MSNNTKQSKEARLEKIVISLLATVGLIATSNAFGNQGMSEVSGVIRNTLPKASATDFSKNQYVKPATTNISTVQYCGDGDVAHYAKTHGNVDFVTNGNVKFALGYWTQDPGKAKTPTQLNWNSLAYLEKMNSDGASTKKMLGIEDGSEDLTANYLADVQQLFKNNKGYSMPGSTGSTKYNTYIGVMMCKDFQTNIKSGPSAKSLVQFFGSGKAQGAIFDKVSELVSAGKVSEAAKVDIKMTATSISLEAGSGKTVSHNFVNMAKSIMALKYPGGGNVDAYKSGVKSVNAVGNLASKFRAANTCISLGNTESKRYWWEHVPQGATCAALGGESGFIGPVIDLLGLDPKLDVAGIPDATNFESLKKQIATRLVAAAIVSTAQKDISSMTSTKRASVSCVPAGGRYVDKIMGSIVFDIKGSKKSHSMIHPEGNFAIGGDAPYRSNDYAVFNMSKGGSPSSQSPGYLPDHQKPTVKNKPADLTTRALDLRFNVRGVGCSKNVYCNLDELNLLDDRS